MNGRITRSGAPEGRLAAVCRSLIIKFSRPLPDRPDYADLHEWLRIYVVKELLMARLDEADKPRSEERKKGLEMELKFVEEKIKEIQL